MFERLSSTRTRLTSTDRAAQHTDVRVRAVLEVLGGGSPASVARKWGVDPALLLRWVRAFVDAGTAQVTNTPRPDTAQQRDRFLAVFAHELRTPLAVAHGWLGMLAEGDLPPSALESTIARLDDALSRLNESIVDVELLAAASLGRLRLSRQRVTVADVVDGLPGLDDVAGEGPDVPLLVDRDLFRRVMRDLWSAGSLAPAPESVHLEVESVDPWLELRVVRRAEPVPAHVLQALFDPFDSNSDDTGVTVGLYLARALVVAHGGTIGVEQDDDTGVLWVRIPR